MSDENAPSFIVQSLQESTLTEALQNKIHHMFTAHLETLSLKPDPELDDDMHDFPQYYLRPHNQFWFVVQRPKEKSKENTFAENIVGMAGLRFERSSLVESENEEGEKLSPYVSRLFVEPNVRCKGLATQILKKTILHAEVQRSAQLFAWIQSSNEASRRCFEGVGFERDQSPDLANWVEMSKHKGCARYVRKITPHF